MKKNILFLTVLFCSLLLFSTNSLAKGGEAGTGSGNEESGSESVNQGKIQKPVVIIREESPKENDALIQNKIETQNMGEAQQLQNTIRQKTETGELGGKQGERTGQYGFDIGSALQGANTQLRKLAEMAKVGDETGEQIKNTVLAQQRSQLKVQEYSAVLESRQGMMRSILGPNYGAIKGINEEIGQNQIRIQKLTTLQTQIENQATKTQIQEAIMSIETQNTALESQVQMEKETPGLFGWFFKLLP